MYTLIADGGDLTAGRRTASYVYGDWNVSVPDGDEQLKLDEKLGDGFVCRINNGRRLGRMDHTFVKEDVSIDMESKTTDLEAVVEDVFGRTSGDLYFQRDLTGVGLNGTVPLRDYNVGDPVRVVRWGKAIPTIVTGIRVSSDKDDRRGYTVHVGGELIKNRRLSNKLSDELRRQVARELVDVRNDIGATNRNTQRAITTAGNAYTRATNADTKADNAVTTAKVAKNTAYETWNKVVSIDGEIQGYVKETEGLVEQARESARRAKDALDAVDPKLFEVREAVASARLLKTAVDERLDGVDSELDDAIAESKAKIIDPAVKQVTDLLQQSTTANREAIRLNNEADGFRDQALTDLTDASEKLKKSQANLVEATAKNSDSVDTLTKAQKEHLAVTRELGTAQEALRKSDAAQSKALAAVEQAQKTETETRERVDRNNRNLINRLGRISTRDKILFESVQVASQSVFVMGDLGSTVIDRTVGDNVCKLRVTRDKTHLYVENIGQCPAVVDASANVIIEGLLTNTEVRGFTGSNYIGKGEKATVLATAGNKGVLVNILVTTRFTPDTVYSNPYLEYNSATGTISVDEVP